MAASVCSTLMYTSPRVPCGVPGSWKRYWSEPEDEPELSPCGSGASEDATAMVRSRVEMIPSVTVFGRPRGAPMATASSPTFKSPDRPIWMGVRSGASILMTARSDSGSVPTTVAA